MSEIVLNNFLDKNSFLNIKNTLFNEYFPWYYNQYKVFENDNINNYQFTHIFYENFNIKSDFFNVLSPLIERINPLSLLRIKANLTPRTENIYLYDYHIDYEYQCKTAVYYINSNNGKTIFLDGKEIDSVENRILIFDSKKQHAGTTCTDSKVRIVININYLEKKV